MISRHGLLLAGLAVLIAAPLAVESAVAAQPASGTQSGKPQAAQQQMTIGYIELADDPRYDPQRAYDRIQVRPLGRPFDGAREGVAEAAAIGRVVGTGFAIRRASGKSVDDLAATVSAWLQQDVHFVITDLTAGALLSMADRFKSKPILFVNASAPDDRLRGKDCRANIVDAIPSDAMAADALMQYLVSKKWRNILVLQGPLARDRDIAAAVSRSAKRFGTRIVAVKPFRLTNDPRLREQSNVALMSAGDDYDVVWVIDSDGDFARYVPYQTNRPRPVVGSAGLVATAWAWPWDAHGALQLEHRFEKLAGRRMAALDWAAWAGVKALVEVVLRTRTTDYDRVRSYLLSDRMNIDGYKGNPMSFRSWDHQMRQPMLVATSNAVVARAPIAGFLHRSNDLDTLGIDRPESACGF
jgi:ABC transporter substrate binding protein (PQQ-dependent alcohol dehydrogenase system)